GYLADQDRLRLSAVHAADRDEGDEEDGAEQLQRTHSGASPTENGAPTGGYVRRSGRRLPLWISVADRSCFDQASRQGAKNAKKKQDSLAEAWARGGRQFQKYLSLAAARTHLRHQHGQRRRVLG